MKRLRLGFILIGALFLSPALARAGGLALMADAGWRTMSNSPETEKAIFGQSSGIGAGLGLTYDRGSRWRFGIEARRINREGERAFAVDRDSEAFRLGHPLTLKMTETLATVTFRFSPIGPVSPYVGVGGGLVSWKESSNIAGLVENGEGSDGLFEARVGIERQQGKVRLALEGGITLAPNTIGLGGISKVYEETDLGGLFVVFKLGFSQR